MALPNLLDPMIRYDDFPALFADPSGFWSKTLHEGRWINYLWHLRGVETPAWLNFAVYQTLWASFAAALAVLTCRVNLWFAAVLALTILVAPPASLISLWFNTLIPGLAIVAIYAIMATQVSQRTLRLWLPPFVVVSFMAYTTYPVLLLAICLVATRDRSLRDLLGLLALFVFSFALAVIVTYTINWQVHGIFGVPLAEWRNARPAGDIAGLWANRAMLWQTFADVFMRSSFEFWPAGAFHLSLLGVSTIVLFRHARREALYLWAGLIVGLSLMVLQCLKLGLVIAPRSFIFAWVFYAVMAVRAAQIMALSKPQIGRWMTNAVLLVLGSYLLQTFQQYTTYRAWQAETRSIARAVAEYDGPWRIDASIRDIRSAQAAFIQSDQALAFRLQQWTGTAPEVCDSNCPGVARLQEKGGLLYLNTAD